MPSGGDCLSHTRSTVCMLIMVLCIGYQYNVMCNKCNKRGIFIDREKTKGRIVESSLGCGGSGEGGGDVQ